jgi:succinyl-CoA synthetase beta subunit
VLLPASKHEIERALCSLRVTRLLEGYRGSQEANIPQIADALHRLCATFLEARSEVAEIEINPMFVYPDHIVAIDALIQVPRP